MGFDGIEKGYIVNSQQKNIAGDFNVPNSNSRIA